MNPSQSGKPPREFRAACHAAVRHLERQSQGDLRQLSSNLEGALPEHITFRIGSRLYYVYIDIESYPFAGERKTSFIEAAHKESAIPCVLPMRMQSEGFVPILPDWGLMHAETHELIVVDDPTEELVEKSDAELHEFAVRVVAHQLDMENRTILTQAKGPADPSLWFQDEAGTCWVVIRSARFPALQAARPSNLADIAMECDRRHPGARGFFASVVFANADSPPTPDGAGALPIFRGNGMLIRFAGLEPLDAPTNA